MLEAFVMQKIDFIRIWSKTKPFKRGLSELPATQPTNPRAKEIGFGMLEAFVIQKMSFQTETVKTHHFK
jgi:hypothetical protein